MIYRAFREWRAVVPLPETCLSGSGQRSRGRDSRGAAEDLVEQRAEVLDCQVGIPGIEAVLVVVLAEVHAGVVVGRVDVLLAGVSVAAEMVEVVVALKGGRDGRSPSGCVHRRRAAGRQRSQRCGSPARTRRRCRATGLRPRGRSTRRCGAPAWPTAASGRNGRSGSRAWDRAGTAGCSASCRPDRCGRACRTPRPRARSPRRCRAPWQSKTPSGCCRCRPHCPRC